MNKRRKTDADKAAKPRLPQEELRRLVINKRRISLKRLLIQTMNLPMTHELPELEWDDIVASGLDHEVLRIVKMLDLREKDLQLPLAPPEIEFCNVGILFDEEDQFNVHRFTTLQSSLYDLALLQPLEHYGAYCQLAEASRARQANKRKQPSVRKVKLQALQDYLYDCFPIVHLVPIVRISVYDLFETPLGVASMHDLLLQDDEISKEVLVTYFKGLFNDLSENFVLDC